MEDDIKGLPNVDLGPVIDDLQKDQQQQRQDQPPQKEGFGQFKTAEDVLKSYKEVQGYATKVSQENKTLKEQMASLQEQFEIAKLGQTTQQVYQQQPQYAGGEEPIEVKIQKAVLIQGMEGVLEEEAEKDRQSFQERYAYAQAVAREYPQLATSTRGVKKLFELGDKLMKTQREKNASKALESIFGGPLDEEGITRLRTLVMGDKAIQQNKQFNQNAYMPDTSTSTRSGSEMNRNQNYDTDIKESVKLGDVDGVIGAIFKKALAE